MYQKKRSTKRLISLCPAFFLLFIVCGFFDGMKAEAASYSGRGSKSDPYIIQTAEQLDGIRDNLNAHYKLGNTIDLSSVADFKPIGSLKTPFKGSLSCDLDGSGKPLYAIKNLKILVNPPGSTWSEKFSGYKQDGSSGWEAGLFGCAQASAFTNILILDVNLTSKVATEGKYQMNPDYSVNPGQDDMAAAALVAIGKNLTVKGCGVSGTVTSGSNHVGGLIGYMADSSVSCSWSTATVTSTGTWGTGGLVGSVSGTSSISESFYNGTMTGGSTHAGALSGSAYGDKITVTDCWAGGIVKTESSGCFLGTKNHTDGNQLLNTDIAKQCYTLAKIEGRAQIPGGNRLKNANYAAKEAGVLEVGFFAATMDEINTVFSAFSAWKITAGSYPQLKNVIAVPDSSAYKPGAVTQSPASSTAATASEAPDEWQSDAQDGTETAESDTKTTGSGSDEIGGSVNANFSENDTLLKLRTSEKVLIGIVTALIVLSAAGSAVTIVLILRKKGQAR
ncbi:MAG: hypothetical protein LBQ48_04535 [Oscillospiraceae bacterium]|jgi:hypothetical protein|nr:hypothetical protein [Oscillospiraceae bacterium]